MPFKSLEEAFDALHEEDVEAFLKVDAEAQGIPWHEYCYKYGIVGTAQKNRIKRHEAQFDPDLLTNEKKAEEEERNE